MQMPQRVPLLTLTLVLTWHEEFIPRDNLMWGNLIAHSNMDAFEVLTQLSYIPINVLDYAPHISYECYLVVY